MVRVSVKFACVMNQPALHCISIQSGIVIRVLQGLEAANAFKEEALPVAVLPPGR